jgi:hypothetical protein
MKSFRWFITSCVSISNLVKMHVYYN